MNRTYRIQGRNGHFAVDEHNSNDTGVTGPLFTGTRKDAQRVADALNGAYLAGRQDAGRDIARAAEDLHTVANTAAVESAYSRGDVGQAHGPWHDRPAPPCPECSRPDPHSHTVAPLLPPYQCPECRHWIHQGDPPHQH